VPSRGPAATTQATYRRRNQVDLGSLADHGVPDPAPVDRTWSTEGRRGGTGPWEGAVPSPTGLSHLKRGGTHGRRDGGYRGSGSTGSRSLHACQDAPGLSRRHLGSPCASSIWLTHASRAPAAPSCSIVQRWRCVRCWPGRRVGSMVRLWGRTTLDSLPLPNGIPSPDTFGRVFSRLDLAHRESGLPRWGQVLVAGASASGGVVAVDGTTVRAVRDRQTMR
jgi:hypothetical protein